jgi:hypothetical protein
MRSIEFFAGSSVLSSQLEQHEFSSYTLDFVQVKNTRKVDFLMDFMDFDYSLFSPGHFDVLYFGQPCTCFSKASGGLHFDKNWQPLTPAAHNAILQLSKTFEIIKYFCNAVWYIENPAGRLFSFPPMQEFLKSQNSHVYRIDLGAFGFITKKQTDIFTNSKVILLSNPMHRVNGKHQAYKFDNLSKVNRQKYPEHFCKWIAENAKRNFL